MVDLEYHKTMMDSRWQKVLDELEKDVMSHQVAAAANQMAIDIIRKRFVDVDRDSERSKHEIQFDPIETRPSAEEPEKARDAQRKKQQFSEEARKKMADAQKRRWARYRAQKRKATRESKK
jgi:hypothetical protein